MQFKEWFFNEFTSSGGGFPVDTPFNPGNSNMPIRSKWQANDVGPEDDGNARRFNTDSLFGFKHWQKRRPDPKYNQANVPIRDNRPDMA